MKLVWTAKAQKALLDILSYISEDSLARALRFGQKIEKRASMLTHFPEIGRKIPEFRNEYSDLREMIIDDYRLVYRMHSKHVGIITIFHGRRQISSAL